MYYKSKEYFFINYEQVDLIRNTETDPSYSIFQQLLKKKLTTYILKSF